MLWILGTGIKAMHLHSVYRSEHIDVQIILLIVASGSQKRDWQRGREKKDREEEVLSPDSVMQAFAFWNGAGA